MGGLERIKPTVIPEAQRERYTCMTLGCPDAAVVVITANTNAERNLGDSQYPYWAAEAVTTPGKRTDGGLAQIRLCWRCVRTLATALPAGHRLPGARLRYPELGGKAVAAPHEIPDTPEWNEVATRKLLDAIHNRRCPKCVGELVHEPLVNMDYCNDLMCGWNRPAVRRAVNAFLAENAAQAKAAAE